MPRFGLMLAVALGGAVGAVLRYLVAHWVRAARPGGGVWPLHTLGVNVVGCLLLGVLSVWLAQRGSEAVRVGLTVGLLGALTTFSTYSVEALALLEARHYGVAAAYLGASVVLGLLAAAAGVAGARALLGQ